MVVVPREGFIIPTSSKILDKYQITILTPFHLQNHEHTWRKKSIMMRPHPNRCLVLRTWLFEQTDILCKGCILSSYDWHGLQPAFGGYRLIKVSYPDGMALIRHPYNTTHCL